MSAPEFFQAVSHLAERRIGQRAMLARRGLFCWRWALATGPSGRAFTQAGARRAIRRALRRETLPAVVTTEPNVRRAA